MEDSDMGNNEIQQHVKDAACPDHGPYVARRIIVFDRPFGWSKCPVCEREKADREAEAKIEFEKAERQRILEEKLDRSGIPLRFRSRTFDSFVADTKEKADRLREMREFSDEFAERAAEGATYVLSGKPGTGKSHLAIAACQQIMSSGYTVMYVNALDAVRMVRATWRRDSEKSEGSVIGELSRVGLLVIDEVGMQYGTEGEQVILFDIINRRYQDQRPMILLTNQGKEGLRQYLGDRSFDRLREAGRWLAFDWESRRGVGK